MRLPASALDTELEISSGVGGIATRESSLLNNSRVKKTSMNFKLFTFTSRL